MSPLDSHAGSFAETRLADSKTGARVVPLPPAAAKVLVDLSGFRAMQDAEHSEPRGGHALPALLYGGGIVHSFNSVLPLLISLLRSV